MISRSGNSFHFFIFIGLNVSRFTWNIFFCQKHFLHLIPLFINLNSFKMKMVLRMAGSRLPQGGSEERPLCFDTENGNKLTTKDEEGNLVVIGSGLKQRIFSSGISTWGAAASASGTSENIVPEQYSESFQACALAKFSFSGNILFPGFDSTNSTVTLKRNAETIGFVRVGADTDGLVGTEDMEICNSFYICGVIEDLLPDDIITLVIANNSATKSITMQNGSFDIEEL